MDKDRIVKELEKKAPQIKQRIDRVRDQKEKERLIRNYAELVSVMVDISEILS